MVEKKIVEPLSFVLVVIFWASFKKEEKKKLIAVMAGGQAGHGA